LILIQFIFDEIYQENIGWEELGLKLWRSEKKKQIKLNPSQSHWPNLEKP